MSTTARRPLSVPGARPVVAGSRARVELANGDVFPARVSYVSGELVGLRAATSVDGQVAAGDTVSIVIGEGASMVAAQARVLAASGSLLRLARRESAEGLERRRALRVPVELPARVAVMTGERDIRRSEAQVTDMSASGCAISLADELPMGALVALDVRIGGTEVCLMGRIVRTWRNEESRGEHAGIQFEPLDARTTSLLNRFLIEQLRATSSPVPLGSARPFRRL
jgi:hypothetical protein